MLTRTFVRSYNKHVENNRIKKASSHNGLPPVNLPSELTPYPLTTITILLHIIKNIVKANSANFSQM